MNRAGVFLLGRDVVVIIAPAVALGVFQVWSASNGPAAANAAVEAAPSLMELSTVESVRPTEVETAVMERAAQLEEYQAPDVFPERVDLTQMAPPDPGNMFPLPFNPKVPDEDPRPQDAPELVVTSIMGGRVPIAVINGRAHRVGDKVGAGWIVQSISNDTVTILHLDGRTKQLRIDRFGP